MSHQLHISVDLDADGDPIAGTVTSGDEQRRFTGWLGLLAGLESAIEGRRRPDPDPDDARARRFGRR